MTLEVIQEVTEWAVDYRQPNHVYLMKGEKVIGYQKWGEGPPIYYTTKQKLNKSRRKFVKIPLKESVFKTVDILVK
jgi:proline dehydrogenase